MLTGVLLRLASHYLSFYYNQNMLLKHYGMLVVVGCCCFGFDIFDRTLIKTMEEDPIKYSSLKQKFTALDMYDATAPKNNKKFLNR